MFTNFYRHTHTQQSKGEKYEIRGALRVKTSISAAYFLGNIYFYCVFSFSFFLNYLNSSVRLKICFCDFYKYRNCLQSLNKLTHFSDKVSILPILSLMWNTLHREKVVSCYVNFKKINHVFMIFFKKKGWYCLLNDFNIRLLIVCCLAQSQVMRSVRGE